MQHGLWLRNTGELDPAALVDRAVDAEAAGWDGVFVSDSLPYGEYPDPWVLLGGMAARTETVTLGTWVVPVPRREPWELAAELATLDRLSGGRVLFGAGLGNDDEYPAYGRPYDPPALGARYDEALEVIDGLWGDGPFSYDGEHFTLEAATVEPSPVQQPRVPILAGAWWPNRKPIRRGARWDGIMPFWTSLVGEDGGPRGEEAVGTPTEELRDCLTYYHEVADEPGEVLVPWLDPEEHPDYADACGEYGVTWALSTLDPADEAAVAAGPPT
ncbi:MAG: LLM class flavin-dependent oxidoreductase [Halobacteriales archaeon]|nr:LLM class flavin-dependent oxidoreductase [Halobacteriales archaeon]